MNTDVMGVFYYVNDFYYKYDKTVSSFLFFFFQIENKTT